MKRPGYNLRLALLAAGIDTDDQSRVIAELLGHSVEWVRDRMSHRKAWTIPDATLICNEFGLSKSKMYDIFS